MGMDGFDDLREKVVSFNDFNDSRDSFLRLANSDNWDDLTLDKRLNAWVCEIPGYRGSEIKRTGDRDFLKGMIYALGEVDNGMWSLTNDIGEGCDTLGSESLKPVLGELALKGLSVGYDSLFTAIDEAIVSMLDTAAMDVEDK